MTGAVQLCVGRLMNVYSRRMPCGAVPCRAAAWCGIMRYIATNYGMLCHAQCGAAPQRNTSGVNEPWAKICPACIWKKNCLQCCHRRRLTIWDRIPRPIIPNHLKLISDSAAIANANKMSKYNVTKSSADAEIARHASCWTQYWMPSLTDSEQNFGYFQ